MKVVMTALLALGAQIPLARAADKAPAKQAPAKQAPAEQAPTQQAPVEQVPAQAQQPPAQPAPAQQTPSVKVTRGAGGEKVYRITEGIVIEGKIQKPEAFYVLQRSTINYDWETLKQDFVPKVLDSVKHSPF